MIGAFDHIALLPLGDSSNHRALAHIKWAMGIIKLSEPGRSIHLMVSKALWGSKRWLLAKEGLILRRGSWTIREAQDIVLMGEFRKAEHQIKESPRYLFPIDQISDFTEVTLWCVVLLNHFDNPVAPLIPYWVFVDAYGLTQLQPGPGAQPSTRAWPLIETLRGASKVITDSNESAEKIRFVTGKTESQILVKTKVEDKDELGLAKEIPYCE